MRFYRRGGLVWKLSSVSDCNQVIIEASDNFSQSIAGGWYGILGQKNDNAAIAEILDGELPGAAMIELGTVDSNYLETR
jgi:hypothetical protein